MSWDQTERRRREHNYRWMFRAALALFASGAILTLLGLVVMILSGNTLLFGFGLIVAALAGMSGYFSVRSTAKIIDLDMRERPRS